MEIRRVMTQNWLTLKPRTSAFLGTLGLVALLTFGTLAYLSGSLGADSWMPASKEAVLGRHEYWRLWTALIAHADLAHVLGNLLLFVPFSYFLLGHFESLFFPIAGFFLSGLANYFVVAGLPPETALVGASGWVYWMGAASLTLYLLIDLRDSLRRRIGKAFVIGAVLFLPETYRAEVSYLAHFYGFILGAASSAIWYRIKRERLRAADAYALVVEDGDARGQPIETGLNFATLEQKDTNDGLQTTR